MLKTISLVGVVLGVLKLCSVSFAAGIGWGLIASLVIVPIAIQLVLVVLAVVLGAAAMR